MFGPGGGWHRLDSSDDAIAETLKVDSDLVAALRQNDPAALAAGSSEDIGTHQLRIC
jgi:hypothetical protein